MMRLGGRRSESAGSTASSPTRRTTSEVAPSLRPLLSRGPQLHDRGVPLDHRPPTDLRSVASDHLEYRLRALPPIRSGEIQLARSLPGRSRRSHPVATRQSETHLRDLSLYIGESLRRDFAFNIAIAPTATGFANASAAPPLRAAQFTDERAWTHLIALAASARTKPTCFDAIACS